MSRVVGAKTSHGSRLERSKVDLEAPKGAPKVAAPQTTIFKVARNLPGGPPESSHIKRLLILNNKGLKDWRIEGLMEP